MPLSISVVIPCYNGEAHLAEALTSVFEQSRLPAEVIVVDDSSADRSREIARRFPVRLIELSRNGGQAAARNAGIAVAKGDVIANFDADDRWEVNHLETVGGLLDRHPDADAAFSAVRRFGAESTVFKPMFPPGQPVDVFWRVFRATAGPHPSSAVRRSAFLGAGGYTEGHYAEDYDLWLRMSKRGKFVCTHEVTCNYRVHQRQLSTQVFRARQAVYASRRQLVESAERAMSPDAVELRAALNNAWLEDLTGAWTARELPYFRKLLSLRADFEPLPRDVLTRWRVRACVPGPLIRLRDRMR